MIVVDSSALIAILFEEPEKKAFQNIIAGDDRCVMSAVNAHETATVLRLRHSLAAVAFDLYGKGINARARLNLSDCAAYALAKTMNAPLLFKGDDFTETDLRSRL